MSCSDCGKIKHNREIEARSIDGTITICDACIEALLSPDPEDELPYLKAMRGANGGIYRSANPRAPIIGFKRKTMYVLCGQTVTIIDRRSNREFVFYDGTSDGPLDLRTVARTFPLWPRTHYILSHNKADVLMW